MAMATNLPCHVIRQDVRRGCRCTCAWRHAAAAAAARTVLRRRSPRGDDQLTTGGDGVTMMGRTGMMTATAVTGKLGVRAG